MRQYPDLDGISIHRQPNDTTCGPTCLHAVYSHFGVEVVLDDLLSEVPHLRGGGTLGVLLANHALQRGFQVKIVTWNLQVFDPTWFKLSPALMRSKVLERAKLLAEPRLTFMAEAYAQFLENGGRIEFKDLEPALLRGYLKRGIPILTGLSATFLYREAREDPNMLPDDVGGSPAGHFVLLTGYRRKTREVLVTDPLFPNPLAKQHTYPVRIERVVGAIYLGVLTHDANLVVMEPTRNQERV